MLCRPVPTLPHPAPPALAPGPPCSSLQRGGRTTYFGPLGKNSETLITYLTTTVPGGLATDGFRPSGFRVAAGRQAAHAGGWGGGEASNMSAAYTHGRGCAALQWSTGGWVGCWCPPRVTCSWHLPQLQKPFPPSQPPARPPDCIPPSPEGPRVQEGPRGMHPRDTTNVWLARQHSTFAALAPAPAVPLPCT